MSNYKIIDKGQQPHFLTLTLVGHLPIFTYETLFQIVINNFSHYRSNSGLKIYVYVIMDNHIHLIASAPDLSQVMQSMK